jgi:hypothetical protein
LSLPKFLDAHLEALSLRDSQVTDADLSTLVGLTHLHWPDLSGTGITNDGLRVMNEMPSLKMVIVKRTQVTDAGIADLRHTMPGLTVEK